jgi:transcriptional regulator with XRE-family HTH domain
VDVCFVIQQRLKELGLEQRDLATAAQVTESYISQLLTRKKAPPAADRTDLYEKMTAFLKLPKGQLSAMAEAQRREELKKKLADPPAPIFKEVRELIIRKCQPAKRMEVREIFEKQAFGELERLVTQTLLDVTKRIAREELETENWPRNAAKLRRQSHEEMRAITLDFLDTDVFNVSIDHCAAFLEPMIDSWDIDLKTFGMEIELNKGLAATEFLKFQFVETGGAPSSEEEPGLQEFLGNAALSGNATSEEVAFLKSLRFREKRPSALYYYREMQSLRDPLHFPEGGGTAMHKHRHASEIEKLLQMESRKSAIRRWTRNRKDPRKLRKAKPA